MSSVMRSKYTAEEIEKVTFEYRRMLEAAIAKGNELGINSLVQIIADLQSCVKRAPGGYNKDDD